MWWLWLLIGVIVGAVSTAVYVIVQLKGMWS